MHTLVDSTTIYEIKQLQKEILERISIRPNSDELISLDQAALLTGVEYQKLREMYLNGEIPGKRFGRAIRLSKTHLLKCDI